MNNYYQYISTRIQPAELSERVFQGELVVFEQKPSVLALVDYLRSQCEVEFHATDPFECEHKLTSETFKIYSQNLQNLVLNDSTVKNLFFKIQEELGVSIQDIYHDKFALRIFPSKIHYQGQRMASAPVHRDSWGSNLYAQINWWMPVYPVNNENTLLFYPKYWDQSIENNSATWSHKNYQHSLKSVAQETRPNYSAAPTPVVDVEADDAVAVLINPGDLLCFSGAHLHAGIENTSGKTRISFETRTINIDDLMTNRGAPNVDGQYPKSHPEWFKHAVSGLPLAI